ncbi:hypothetical protein [Pedobacter sp. R-06]|uniref:hypothetical protein n=1 Tax=Pedobacter sp. R-06 TaxID=3404051 RepID=UPI003CED3D2E
MTGLNLISVFAIIAVTISLILAVFLLTVKTKHKLSNVLLATFILINGMDLSMLFTGQWLQHYPGLLVFLITVSLLNNPIFYLYALSICYSDLVNGIKQVYNENNSSRYFRLTLVYNFGNSAIKIKQRDFGNDDERRRTN